MKIVNSISFIILTFLSFAQTGKSLEDREIKLDSLLANLRAAETNAERKELNRIFKDEMESFVTVQGALTYNFTKLQTVGIIDSPDKLVRIINWNVEQEDLSHQYFCFVLHFDKKKNKYQFNELKDNSFGMPSQPTGMITQDNWYGALYYKIIPIEKGTRTMYTLIGWDYNSTLSQMKLLDVIYFSGSDVKLGSPIFKLGKTTQYRVFFEHSKKATMYLNYEKERKRIMLDHLSPEAPALKNFRSYYVPDLSYDAFVYEDNKWVLVEDVIGVNDNEGESQVIYAKSKKTGLLEETELKKEWINPEDSKAPAGGSAHVAVTPDDQEKDNNKKIEGNSELDQLNKRVSRKDKRNPNGLSKDNFGKKKKTRKKKKG